MVKYSPWGWRRKDSVWWRKQRTEEESQGVCVCVCVCVGEAWWLRLLSPALQSGLALIHLSLSDYVTLLGCIGNANSGFSPCPALPARSHPSICIQKALPSMQCHSAAQLFWVLGFEAILAIEGHSLNWKPQVYCQTRTGIMWQV